MLWLAACYVVLENAAHDGGIAATTAGVRVKEGCSRRCSWVDVHGRTI